MRGRMLKVEISEFTHPYRPCLNTSARVSNILVDVPQESEAVKSSDLHVKRVIANCSLDHEYIALSVSVNAYPLLE